MIINISVIKANFTVFKQKHTYTRAVSYISKIISAYTIQYNKINTNKNKAALPCLYAWAPESQFNAPQINICVLTVDQMITCSEVGVTLGNKPNSAFFNIFSALFLPSNSGHIHSILSSICTLPAQQQMADNIKS